MAATAAYTALSSIEDDRGLPEALCDKQQPSQREGVGGSILLMVNSRKVNAVHCRVALLQVVCCQLGNKKRLLVLVVELMVKETAGQNATLLGQLTWDCVKRLRYVGFMDRRPPRRIDQNQLC